jgi:hypothetical protein
MSLTHLTQQLPPTSTRVEGSTESAVNDAIRARTDAEVARLEGADPDRFAARLGQLDGEWDIERVLQANAGTFALAGTLLGYRVDRRFLVLPAVVFSFLANHAVRGWCPPLPIFRRQGVRTAREIERERYAIKALRGDFERVPLPNADDKQSRVRAALEAVDA